MARNAVRIIGGKWRGRKLRFAPVAGLRPTLDRSRETLFNWLAADIPGARVVDLFAGTGALAFEALSRGAAAVTAVERHPQVANRLRAQAAELDADLAVVHADALRWLRGPGGAIAADADLLFLDPPYASPLLGRCLTLLETLPLGTGVLLYLEHAAGEDSLPGPAWDVLRETRAGGTVSLLVRPAARAAAGLPSA